jgi:hypothetical protein
MLAAFFGQFVITPGASILEFGVAFNHAIALERVQGWVECAFLKIQHSCTFAFNHGGDFVTVTAASGQCLENQGGEAAFEVHGVSIHRKSRDSNTGYESQLTKLC